MPDSPTKMAAPMLPPSPTRPAAAAGGRPPA
jgi:hypothetical protein